MLIKDKLLASKRVWLYVNTFNFSYKRKFVYLAAILLYIRKYYCVYAVSTCKFEEFEEFGVAVQVPNSTLPFCFWE